MSDVDFIRRIQTVAAASGDPSQVASRLSSIVANYHFQKVTDYLVSVGGLAVRTGPFAGTKFVEASRSSRSSLFPPKLIGCYESELHPIMNQIVKTPYSRVVDVGCAEGYYVVGLARRMRDIHVFGFDIDEPVRESCRQMVDANGVAARVSLEGICTHGRLSELASLKTLIICDIEGAEIDLLDPVKVPRLAECDILVECHDCFTPTISFDLASRFKPTHHISGVINRMVNPNKYPVLRRLKPIEKFFAVWEGRPGLTPWLMMRSKRRTEVGASS
jgi:SAM-dependent methyltransferase